MRSSNATAKGDISSYLTQHYVTADRFAAHCGVTPAALQELIDAGLAPKPSYVVTADARIASYVFGDMDAPGAPPGSWFAPSTATWVQRARDALTATRAEPASEYLQAEFKHRYREALLALHANDGPIPGLHTATGEFDDAAYARDFDETWTHFLEGTFGLCVANPHDESRIALKESLQNRLAALTDKGERTDYPREVAAQVRHLIDRYVEASMAFSPVEYPRSSRKRLVDDVLARLDQA